MFQRARTVSWPHVLLLLSLGIMLGTAYQAHRLEQHRRRTAEQLVRDYAAFAAWSYQNRLSNALQEAAWQVVNPILHHDLHQSDRIPDATNLIGYLARSQHECSCSPPARPATYFGFILGSDTVGTAGLELSAAERAVLNRRITRYLRTTIDPPPGRMGMLGADSLASGLLSYGLMPTIRGDTAVYGFIFDPVTLPALFHETFKTYKLLPPSVSQGRPNREILAVQVLDATGTTLFADSAWPAGTSVAEEQLPARAGSLRVRATVRPEVIGALVAGAGTRNQLPLLFAVVALAFVLAIVALVQLRRENQLARMRADFVASVSHELRTPLAQIRLFLDTLRLRRYRTDEQRDWLLGHLVRETTRLEQLVDNVLQFSRLEQANAAPLALETADPAAEVRETLAAFEPLAQSRQVTLAPELAEGMTISLDRARFRQLLLNLLDNAVKFGPAGQRVQVILEQAAALARLRVTDQGPGVPAAERETIWEPYRRGSGEAGRAVGGSGIGLAIVRDAATRLGGRAWVEEAPGGGAMFVVELPLQATEAARVAS